MAIRIGNGNRIKKSIIVDGNDNVVNEKDKPSTTKKIIITIFATVAAGIILLAIEYYLNVLGIF